jgi:protein-S-isoprenylcysteine O-methyltransferase Ste14
MKQKYFIDTHKGATAIFVLILMAIYRQWDNPTAWIYLALHGTYGFLWILKSSIFPDQAWEEKTGLAFGLVIWGSLSLYWIAPWMLMARAVHAPGWYQALCACIFSFGVFFHFASDMQKHVSLQLRPGQLISDGLFARTRNPNYFGELLIYTGFGLLAMHWLPMVILLTWVLVYWLPRMFKKDRILSTLAGFENYKARSKLFIPFLF